MPDTYPFSANQIAEALTTLQQSTSKKIANGFLMLRANYKAENMEISTGRLGRAAGYDNYNTGNAQYGAFAHQLCDILDYNPKQRTGGNWIDILCEESEEKDHLGHFQWRLRPQVAAALEELGLVRKRVRTDLLDEILARTDELASYPEKERQAIVKARIGQGEYRKGLIRFWDGCSVTGCDCLELLIASHIKPWRDCSIREATDPMNGLLLLPNLDRAFDQGLISFDESGTILLAKELPEATATILGISRNMKLRMIMPAHLPYLQFHREHIFLT